MMNQILCYRLEALKVSMMKTFLSVLLLKAFILTFYECAKTRQIELRTFEAWALILFFAKVKNAPTSILMCIGWPVSHILCDRVNTFALHLHYLYVPTSSSNTNVSTSDHPFLLMIQRFVLLKTNDDESISTALIFNNSLQQ